MDTKDVQQKKFSKGIILIDGKTIKLGSRIQISRKDIPKPIRERMLIDKFIFGDAFYLKKSDGTFKRIDPTKVILNPRDSMEYFELTRGR